MSIDPQSTFATPESSLETLPDGSVQIKQLELLLRRIVASSITEIIRQMRIKDKVLIGLIAQALETGVVRFDGRRYSVPGEGESPVARLALQLFNPHVATSNAGMSWNYWLDKLQEMSRGRPTELQEFEQRHVTVRTSMLRALYLFYRGDLHGRDIVLLGDDDLTSLAILLIGGYRSLAVLEADPRIIEFLESRANSVNRSCLDIIRFNVFDVISNNLLNCADTFFCDPSRKLYLPFLECGLKVTRPTGVLYACLNPSHSPEVGQFVFQREAIRQGMIITDSIPVFNEYTRDFSSLPAEYHRFYPMPSDANDRVSTTETLVRFAHGPDSVEEADYRRLVHER